MDCHRHRIALVYFGARSRSLGRSPLLFNTDHQPVEVGTQVGVFQRLLIRDGLCQDVNVGVVCFSARDYGHPPDIVWRWDSPGWPRAGSEARVWGGINAGVASLARGTGAMVPGFLSGVGAGKAVAVGAEPARGNGARGFMEVGVETRVALGSAGVAFTISPSALAGMLD